MQALPKWIIANPFPALHDFESLTVLDQTARIYGAMNQLIEEWNKMIEQLSAFEKSETESREEFDLKITKVMREFICSTEKHLVLNLDDAAEKYINSAINEGRITLAYDPNTENLSLQLVGGEENE